MDDSKLKRIKFLEKFKYFPFTMILIPIVIYVIIFNSLFSDRKSLTTEEFRFILGLFSFLFLIFLIHSIICAIVMYKSINKSIAIIKKENLWKNYGQEQFQAEPIIIVMSFGPLFMSSIDFLNFFVTNNSEYFYFGVFDLIFFSCLVILFFYSAKLKKKCGSFESTNLGKIHFNDTKKYIEKVINKNNIQYRKLGPNKGFILKSEETYLLNNNFKLFIRSTNKDNVNKFLWPKNMRFTQIIIGEIDKNNKQLVIKIQKEIDKLKKNTE